MTIPFGSHFTDFGYSVIGFMLLMSVVVFVHEFGHYYVARLCGVKVETFSIGFGKKIFSRTDKTGCVWAVSWLPLGGYVKFFGDKSGSSNADFEQLETMSEQDKQVSFYYKKLWQKLAIVLAGPAANVILCFSIFTCLFFFYGIVTIQPIVKDVIADKPAAQAGLIAGDRIISVGGVPTEHVNKVRTEIVKTFGTPVSVEVKRQDKVISLTMKPFMQKDASGQETPMIGVIFTDDIKNITFQNYDITASIKTAYQQTIMIASLTGAFLKNLFLGNADVNQLSGPIKIGDVAGQALQQEGWVFFVQLTAMISMSIGLVNLFPVPMLDGGHAVFYIFEMITGIKPSKTVQEYAFKVGFMLVISLMVFTVLNDLGIIAFLAK